jgi:hypothetical protein
MLPAISAPFDVGQRIKEMADRTERRQEGREREIKRERERERASLQHSERERERERERTTKRGEAKFAQIKTLSNDSSSNFKRVITTLLMASS